MIFTTLTDQQLADHLNAVLAEQERRQDLATIPQTIQALTTKFVDGGGNPEELKP